jgi:hypothetical protein
MRIDIARLKTGFEKCEFGSYESKCESCGAIQNRHNSENYLRTSFEYDEGDYACNKCVINYAKTMHLKYS